MRQTVVGVFDLPDAARAALVTLADDHFSPSRIHALDTARIPTLTEVAVPAEPRTGMLDQLRHLLAEATAPGQATRLYEGMMRRGGAVVSVDVDDQPQAVRAELALVKAGAIDITRHSAG